MKNLILLTLSLLLSTISVGQTIENETRKISSFDKIDVRSVIKVELFKSNSQEIEIYTENIPTDKIKTKVKNGKLILDLETRRKGWDNIEVTVKVPYQNLEKIIGHIASSITSSEKMEFEDLEISLNEASNCQLNVDCTFLDVDLNSAANLKLEGACRQMDANVNSAANLHAFNLEVTNADINASSMANVKINVEKDLDINASSMATVRYMGEPTNLNKKKSSMAKITKVSGNLREIRN